MNRNFFLIANLFLSMATSAALSGVTFAISGHFLLSYVVYATSGASLLVALSLLTSAGWKVSHDG